jgi:hypothetical protein
MTSVQALAQSKSTEQQEVSRRILWLKNVVAGSFLIEVLLSWRMWSGERLFPKLPLLEFLPTASGSVDTIIFSLLIGLLLSIMVHPKPRVLIYFVLALVALLAVADQTRWQPFFYQYYFMLAALAYFGSSAQQHLALITCRWIVVGLYFYAGLQKANIYFVGEVFPWFVEPLVKTLPGTETFFLLFGLVVPFAEMGIAVALLRKGFRPLALVLACTMHVFILLMIGPFGHAWGTIVWPWNISMMILLFILFWCYEHPLPARLTFREHLFHKGTLFLFLVMPLFSFFNLWDSSLSASLYSGTVNRADLYLSKTLKQRLPAELQTFAVVQDNKFLFHYNDWAHLELGVLLPAEARLFKQVAMYVCGYANQPSDVTVVIHGKKTVFRADVATTYTCGSLGKDER